MKNDRFKVGQTIVVNGRGCCYGEGVPIAADGKRAKILGVAKVKLKILIEGDIFPRHIRMERDVRRIVKA